MFVILAGIDIGCGKGILLSVFELFIESWPNCPLVFLNEKLDYLLFIILV